MQRNVFTEQEVARALPSGWRCGTWNGFGWVATSPAGARVEADTALDLVREAGAVDARERQAEADAYDGTGHDYEDIGTHEWRTL